MSLPGIEPGISNTRGYQCPLDRFLTELSTVGGEQGWSDSGSTCIGGHSFSDIVLIEIVVVVVVAAGQTIAPISSN